MSPSCMESCGLEPGARSQSVVWVRTWVVRLAWAQREVSPGGCDLRLWLLDACRWYFVVRVGKRVGLFESGSNCFGVGGVVLGGLVSFGGGSTVAGIGPGVMEVVAVIWCLGCGAVVAVIRLRRPVALQWSAGRGRISYVAVGGLGSVVVLVRCEVVMRKSLM